MERNDPTGGAVLLVDDDEDFRTSLADILTGAGYAVAHAPSAASAFRCLRSVCAEVALVDERLGTVSGTRLVLDIQREFPRTVCVVMTAYAGPETAVQAIRVGAYDYLVKPFEIEEVLSTLRRCFEKVALEKKSQEIQGKLRESEEFYREIFDMVSDGIFVVDVTPEMRYRLVSYNPAQERMIGISASEAVGRFNDEYLPADIAARVNEDNRRCIEAGAPMRFEQSLDLATGRSYFQTMLVPVRNDEGRVHRLIGVARDVTESTRYEQALRLSEEKFSKAFNGSPDSMTISRLEDGVLLEVNPGFVTIYGYTRDEAIGHSSLSHDLGLWADDADRGRLVSMIRERGEVFGEETNFRKRNGAVRRGLVAWKLIEIEGVACILNITEDITERKAMEAELKESEARFRLMAENSTDMISRHDPSGVYLYASPACRALLGYEPEELLGRSAYDFFHPEDLASVSLSHATVMEQDVPYTISYRIRRKDGTWTWLESVSRAVRDPATGDVREIQVSSRDVNERKRAEERDREHERQLFQAAKLASLGTLVSGIGHEINNPNNYIRLNVQNLLEFWPDTRALLERAPADEGPRALHGIPLDGALPVVESLLRGIEEGSRRIEKLLVALRDFARGDDGELTESVNLNEVVLSAVLIVGELIRKSTDSFAFEDAPALPEVRGNYHQLEQVVMNLVTNACQSLPGRDRRVTVRTRVEPGTVVLEVSDQGSGIPAEILPRITDPFFTTKRAAGGTGLGLAVSSRIVANHGGTMSFRSDVGQGTVATVNIPVKAETP